MLVFTIILALLCIVLIAIIMILFFPFRYELQAESYTPMTARCKLNWIGKLLYVRFIYVEEKPFYKEVYIGGKLKYGTEKDYQAWLERKVAEELADELTEEESFAAADSQVKHEPSPHMEVKPTADSAASTTSASDTQEPPAESTQTFRQWWWHAYGQQWDIYGAILGLIERIYHHSKPREFQLSGTFGTGDPADTGMMAGVLYSLWPEYLQDVEFDYIDACYTGKFFIKGRIIPAYLIWYVIMFLVKKPIRPMIIDSMKHRSQGGR